MSPFTAGQRLHDRFVLVDRIGTGGMSEVWRATDEVLGRPVAVKTLAAGLADDPGLREATWREARTAARLTHPNVTRVYDYGEAPLPDGGRAPYLVMELVEGQSLAGRLAAGPLPWPEPARIGAYTAAALAAAHELGVVHHDIKPGNVMLTAGGAKVLDFGTAALIGAIDQDALVGTPTYAAPERLEWAPAQPASDVYSFGVLLYEAITGAPPATLGSWYEAAAAHRADSPPRTPPGLPPEAAELVQACLSPDPAGRPPARQVARALADLAGIPDPTANITAEPPTMVTPAVAAPGAAARGSATRPAPPTQIDDRPPPAAPARRGNRLLLAGLATTAAVLGVLVVALGLALSRSDSPEAGGAPGGSGTAGSSPESSPTPPASTAPPATDARGVLDNVDRAIQDARIDGSLDPDTAQKLTDKLEDVAKELGKRDEDAGKQAEKVRDKADDLREEIAKEQDKGTVSDPLAAELQSLLDPLDELLGRR